MSDDRLFAADFLARVAAIRAEAARRGGERGVGAAGTPAGVAGFDRADARPYTAGDDLRTVDWAALARLDEAIVRRTRDAAPVELAVILDRTPSMRFGEPTKDVAARRVAGALGALGIASGGRARLVGEGGTIASPAAWLARVESARETASAVDSKWRAGAARGVRREWCVLGDLYDAAPLGALVERLRRRGEPVCVAQMRARADVDPPGGAAELVDAETGERRRYAEAERVEFARRRAAFDAAWRERCARLGAAWVELRAEAPWEESVRAVLAARGWTR